MDYAYPDSFEGIINTTYIIDINDDHSNYKKFFIYIELILGILIVLSNGILIVGILSSRDLRNTSKNFLILVLCCVDFFCGAYNHPVLAFFYHTRDPRNPETTNDCGHAFFYYFMDISFACEQGISILVVSAIAVDWTITTTTKSYTPKDRKSLALFMSVCIFLGTIIYVVSYFLPMSRLSYLCFVNYSNKLPMVLVIESPQLLFLALTTLFVIIGYIKEKGSVNSPIIPLDILMASIVTFLFILPSNIFMIITFYFESVLYNLTEWEYMLISRLPAVKRISLPFVWLLDNGIRMALRRC